MNDLEVVSEGLQRLKREEDLTESVAIENQVSTGRMEGP
jgi:hypothetical protein